MVSIKIQQIANLVIRFVFCYNYKGDNMRRKIITSILSFLYSIFMMIGISFQKNGSFSWLTKNIVVKLLIFFLFIIIFYLIINFLFKLIDNKKQKDDSKLSKWKFIFDSHPFIFSFCFIILCWLIYIIAFYPLIMSYDPSYQILQYFHIDNKYSYYSVLLDNNVIITNHHPVIHTLLLGSLAKLGLTLFNQINIGLFFYSLIQITVLATTLAYTISYMKKQNISIKYRIITLIIYGVVPVFPFYAISPVKDVIFGCLVIFYIILFYECLTSKEKINIKKILLFLIIMILLILFRNNGIHLIILSFPVLLLFKSQNKKSYIILFVLILGFYTSYTKIILPSFKITPSSIRETLSIPFQQTARYVSYYDELVTKEEQDIIDKILDYNTLKERYNPEKSDPVKNRFNRFSTKEDLKKYFEVWFKQFKNKPVCYLEATVNNTYGYIYPLKINWYIYHKYNSTLEKNGLDYHYNNLSNLRSILSTWGEIFPYIPIIGLIVNIGFNNWLLLFLLFYLIDRKKYRELFYLLPSCILTLVCFASPVNTYFRYALPNIFATPILLTIFNQIITKKSQKQL